MKADIVRENIVSDSKAADVPWFTLLEDGTRDNNNRGNIAIGICYVKNGKPREALLSIEPSLELNAAILSLI